MSLMPVQHARDVVTYVDTLELVPSDCSSRLHQGSGRQHSVGGELGTNKKPVCRWALGFDIVSHWFHGGGPSKSPARRGAKITIPLPQQQSG